MISQPGYEGFLSLANETFQDQALAHLYKWGVQNFMHETAFPNNFSSSLQMYPVDVIQQLAVHI